MTVTPKNSKRPTPHTRRLRNSKSADTITPVENNSSPGLSKKGNSDSAGSPAYQLANEPVGQRKPSTSSSPRPNGDVTERSQYTLKQILSSRWLRLTHLYKIKDKNSQVVVFKPTREQFKLLTEMSFLNLVLKARQLGMTTAIQIFFLDICIFNDNVEAGVVAHNREDAQKFFRNKIKFAYDNLPQEIRNDIKATNDSAGELVFSNGSSIRVGTSLRSGTLQYLHISEYGKLCAKRADQAEEVRTGALNTVAPGNYVFIESTAEGAYGHFYELSESSMKRSYNSAPLTEMEYKFFFFPWWTAKEYRLHPKNITISPEYEKYFEQLAKHPQGTTLDPEQKAWYVVKAKEQGSHMMREYPSTPEEAFRGSTEGSVFGKQMTQARIDGRIGDYPHLENLPVFTFWDIGRDTTSIWFMQQVLGSSRFIGYHEEPNQSLSYFARLLLQDLDHPYHRYQYAKHYFPHDMAVVEFTRSDQLPRIEVARKLGLKPNEIVPRVGEKNDSIEMGRQALAACFFDEKGCRGVRMDGSREINYCGITSLENYRFHYDPRLECFSKEPVHNAASHGADSYQQYAMGYRSTAYAGSIADDSPISREGRRRQRESNSGHDWRA